MFVHEALPAVLLATREAFVETLRGPNAQSELETFWESVGAAIVEIGHGPALPTNGLAVEPVDGNGWRGVVIHMPKVEQLGECSLVLMIVPNDPVTGQMWQIYKESGAPLVRLFVLKLLQLPPTDIPEFKICELSPLLGHVTTGYTCAENATDFVREVVDGLDVE